MPNSGRSFFRHLRDGESLRKNPLTWLAIGEASEVLPDELLVHTLHDRLSHLVHVICSRPDLASNVARARRLHEIFGRHLLGVRDAPVLPVAGAHQRSLVAAAHRHGRVVVHVRDLGQALGAMPCKVVADLAHRLDGLGVDPA